MGNRFTPPNITKEEYETAVHLHKSGLRWETLRKIKTRIQQAWEYIKKDVSVRDLLNRPISKSNPYRPALQAIELLSCSPFLRRDQIAKHLVILDGYIDADERAILAVPTWPGSL